MMVRTSVAATALHVVAALLSTSSVAAFAPTSTALRGSKAGISLRNNALSISAPSKSTSLSPSSLYMSMAEGVPEGVPEGGVVITGAAGGVGYAYAGEFMDRGYDVVICDVKDCTTAAKALTARHPNGRVYHTKCDVSDSNSVEALGEFAKDKLGTLKYWINNAGVNGGRRALMDVPVDQVELVVKVNLLGILLGTKVAMDLMAQQVREMEIWWWGNSELSITAFNCFAYPV